MTPEEEKFREEYGNLGTKASTPMDFNPSGLKSMMPNNAKETQNPEVLNSGRYSHELTIGGSLSSRRIRLTAIESKNPEQSPNSIAVIDDNGNIIAILGDSSSSGVTTTVYAGTATSGAAALLATNIGSGPFTAPTVAIFNSAPNTFPALDVSSGNSTSNVAAVRIAVESPGDGPALLLNNNNTSTSQPTLKITNNASVATNFKKMIELGTTRVWLSDGTDPNGALSGTAGDLCLNGASNKPAYCTGGTAWTNLV